MMIYADQRWIGKGGIGRFARHVLAGFDYQPVTLASDPASPLDPLFLTRELVRVTPRDIFFSPGYNSPVFCSAPFFLTIHDLNHLDLPHNSSVSKRLYYATVLKRACRLAANVLTVSEFSRGRIIEWSGVSPDKVVNVGNGVDSSFRPTGAPYELKFPYLLCVSNRKLHKNDSKTVEAFARSGLSKSLKLVFTGSASRHLTDCIQQNNVTENVCFVGSVDEGRLPSLYRSAEGLVFASLYEGFGLPVLEAMACGTPVISSNTTALPEVAGAAALLVDPTSVEQLAGAMRRIVTDSSLRSQLRERGLAQASRFSWDACAGKVRQLLSRCDGSRNESCLGATA